LKKAIYLEVDGYEAELVHEVVEPQDDAGEEEDEAEVHFI
jgi:hypothetical protein